MTTQTIGFIGVGNMASVLAKCVAQTNQKHTLLLATRTPSKIDSLAKEIGASISTVAAVLEQADILFIGLKPQQFPAFFAQWQDKLNACAPRVFISMAAGIDLAQLQAYSFQHWIRLMPNMASAVSKGTATYCVADSVTPTMEQLFLQVMATSGTCLKITEDKMGIATAIAGCGPAFVCQFIQALADAGVQYGLTRQEAQTLATQMVAGTADMIATTHVHPISLSEQVCSPNGSTIAGVVKLEKLAFKGTIIEAVEASMQRTQELG